MPTEICPKDIMGFLVKRPGGWEEMAMGIRVLVKHGKGAREIARAPGCSRNSVRRYQV
jgi:hypothetical protein